VGAKADDVADRISSDGHDDEVFVHPRIELADLVFQVDQDFR